MKAEESTISQILTDQICYSIPPYQRPYSWRAENVEQLLGDIWQAYEESDQEYFIGSIITIEKKKNEHYEVVDGQQRLTTLNLILARLRDHIQDQAAQAELGKRVLPRNPLSGATEAPRLQLRKIDQGFFRTHVLDAQPLPIQSGSSKISASQQRILENLQAIDNFLKAKSQETLKLFAHYLLSKVYVVFVKTETWQSAYRLFNVLNARGLSLSNADLIKNALFNKLGAQTERGNELEDRWLELESLIGIDDLDRFLGYQRVLREPVKARNALHEEFYKIIDKQPSGPFLLVNELIASAGHYRLIQEEEFDDVDALHSIRSLKRVNYDDWIPALLAYMKTPVEGLGQGEFISLLEKVTMQNWIRRVGSTARLTVYFNLIAAIARDGKPAADIRQIFREHSNNNEFIELLKGNLYGKPFDEAVLLRLEDSMCDGSVTKVYSGRMTIEHILPQAFKDPYWQALFNDERHEYWVHRLGNLTLLSGSKNYKAQCYDFDRKKAIYIKSGKKVSFDLTKEVCEQVGWNEGVLQARQDNLIERARELWSIN